MDCDSQKKVKIGGVFSGAETKNMINKREAWSIHARFSWTHELPYKARVAMQSSLIVGREMVSVSYKAGVLFRRVCVFTGWGVGS